MKSSNGEGHVSSTPVSRSIRIGVFSQGLDDQGFLRNEVQRLDLVDLLWMIDSTMHYHRLMKGQTDRPDPGKRSNW
jgi:hypothetical protein